MTQPMDEQKYTFDRVARLLLTAGVIIAMVALVRHLSDVLLPFVMAVVLAYLLHPLVTGIERRVKRRWVAVLGTLLGLGLVGVVLLTLLVPLTLHQLGRFERSLQGIVADLPEPLRARADQPEPISGELIPTSQPEDSGKSASGLPELRDGWQEFLNDAGKLPRHDRLDRLYDKVEGTFVGGLVEQSAEFVQTQAFREMVLNALKRLALGGASVLNLAVQIALGSTVLIVVLIYLVFLLLDFDAYRRTFQEMLPPKYRDGILGFLGEFEVAMRRYFRGQFIVALAVGILFSIGFSIIGLPMAVPFGLFVGLLNMVPYLQIAALVPAILLAILRSLETSSGVLGSVILVLVVFGVVQILQDAVIVPRVMGKATGLRPVAILLGVFIWSKLIGFIGLLLAIPLTCLGIAYYRRFVLAESSAHSPATAVEDTPASPG